METFAEDKYILIKICGKVAGFDCDIHKDHKDHETLRYDGIIILDEDLPIYFRGFRVEEEAPNLELEKIILESAKSFPVIMTGKIFSGGINCQDRKIQYHFKPCVIQMGDYISPQPKAEEKEE